MRRFLRSVLLVSITAFGYVPLALVMLLGWPFKAAQRAARNWIFRNWSRCCLWAMGCHLRVEGRPPAAPFFLVSNHLSYIDILVLSSLADVFFIAKSEIGRWPGVGLLSRTVGTIFIDRSLRRDVRRVNHLVEKTLDTGYGVVLFPEGTSSQGYEVLPFKSSLLAFPAQTGLPVYAATLSYRVRGDDPPAHLSICWWGDAPFTPHLMQFLRIGSFEASVRFVEEPVVGDDRKVLAESLRDAVVGAFEPVVSLEGRAPDPGF